METDIIEQVADLAGRPQARDRIGVIASAAAVRRKALVMESEGLGLLVYNAFLNHRLIAAIPVSTGDNDLGTAEQVG